MKNWQPFELHTHTWHSDGRQTVAQLVETAKLLGFRGIALTDHNTISGHSELANIKDEEFVFIKGLEWTTFYGHVLLLGCERYLDWRTLTKENLTEHLIWARENGAAIGIAHPFRIGDPINTGCHFEFDFHQWSLVDYLEVWSLPNPSNRQENKRAYQFWTELLNQGLRITAVSGRDWHACDHTLDHLSATYLLLEEDRENEERVIDSIVNGKAMVTIGPKIEFSLMDQQERIWNIGELIPNHQQEGIVVVRISSGDICSNYQEKEQYRLVLDSNLGTFWWGQIVTAEVKQIAVDLQKVQWLRVSLEEEDGLQVAFTNPIYRERGME